MQARASGQSARPALDGRRRLTRDAMYQEILRTVIEQLRPQLGVARPGQLAALMMIPAVGFGEQSPPVLRRTLELIASQRNDGTVTACIILVNRPATAAADSTEALVRAFIERLPTGNGSIPVALATVQLPQKPRIGELRQVMLDAAAELLHFCPATTGLVIADDDLVGATPEYVRGIVDFLRQRPAVDLVIGPVLFDDTRFPSALLVDFFVADLLRALLSTRLVEYVARLDPSDWHERREMERMSRGYFETVILSGNLGVRVSALEEVGGFADMNELTAMMRDVHNLALAAQGPGRNNLGSPWTFDSDHEDVIERLRASAVQVSSRRAVHAYLRGRYPSVAQWRLCRFRASKIDPVRVLDPAPLTITPIRHLNRTGRRELLDDIERAIARTLEYFPPHRETIVECLSALGIGRHDGTIELESSTPARWSVRIRTGRDLLERIEGVQQGVLEQLGISQDQRRIQLPVEG